MRHRSVTASSQVPGPAASLVVQKAHLAEKVTAGRLTQAEADARAGQVEAAVTERLDDPIRHGRGRHGHRGGPAGADETPSETPSQASRVTPSATVSGSA